MKKVKWLLAGAGDIVKSRVADALVSAENSEVTAIFAPSVGKAESIAEQYHIPLVFHDFTRALTESGADAVYIATPHHTHVALAKQSLAAGKHFLSEKPLGINSTECLSLLECARQYPQLKTACSNYRLFSNQFRTTKRMIDAGEIGELSCGWAHDEEPYYNPSRAPLLKARGMSPIHGFGFYLINMAQALFGMPESVFAASSSFNTQKLDPFDIDDLENIILRFPGGKQFTIYINMVTQGPLRHSYEFCGSAGRLIWPGCPPHFNKPVYRAGWGEDLPVENSVTQPMPGHEKNNWHLPMIQDFVDAVLNNGQPFCTLRSAVETSVITEAAVQSMETGLPVKIEKIQ